MKGLFETGGPVHATGRKRSPRGGFTLVELFLAVSLLTIGLISLLSATSRMHSLRKQNREQTLAQNAMRSVNERIQSTSFQLSDDPDTWASELLAVYGPGGTFGDTFDVPGLAELDGQPTVGTIQIVTDETTTDADLGVDIGMPRDLDGDGAANDADVSTGARILPVVLTIQWRGQNRFTTYQHSFYVMGY